MPDVHDVMDVTFDELTPEQRVQMKDAIDQLQQKCLMSFGKNRSGVPYLKSDMPRVLLPGEPDTTTTKEKKGDYGCFSANYGKHNGQTSYRFLEYVQADDGWSLWPRHGEDTRSSITCNVYCRGWRN
jgi:hypothetical protein